MVPQKKVKDLIQKHTDLETELSSGKIDKMAKSPHWHWH